MSMTARQAKRTAADKGLAYIVKVLNSPSDPRGARLRELVALWQRSGPDTSKLFTDSPRLWAEFLKAWKPAPMLTRTGAVKLGFGFNAGAEGAMPNPAGERLAAMAIFGSLLANPEWDKLGGPCDRCGKFYIKKRDNQKRYCSTKCGNLATSKAQFENLRLEKLEQAESAIAEFRKQQGPNATHWKQWVSEHTGFDLRFLTRNFTESGEVKQQPTTTVKGR